MNAEDFRHSPAHDALAQEPPTVEKSASRRHGAFDAAEQALLKAHYGLQGPKWCLQHLPGRSIDQVKKTARELGLKTAAAAEYEMLRARREHPSMDARIRAGWQRLKRGRFEVADLARELGEPAQWVRRRAVALGLCRPPADRSWTRAEEAVLREMPGASPRRIRAALKARGYERTDSAISTHRLRMGLSGRQDDGAMTAELLASLLGVAQRTVHRWISETGLPARQVDGRFVIDEKRLRSWVSANRTRIELRAVDQAWFMDLAFGGPGG